MTTSITKAERDEIIEQCAAVVDQCNREGPYMAIGAARRIRALKSQPHEARAKVGEAPRHQRNVPSARSYAGAPPPE